MIPSCRFLTLCVAALVLLAAACNGGSSSPGVQGPTEPTATPDPNRPRTPHCQIDELNVENLHLEVRARWDGDKIKVSGTMDQLENVTLSWFFCQDERVAAHFRFREAPTLEDGKIEGESEFVDNPRALDPLYPDIPLEMVLTIQDEEFGLPVLFAHVPVEGNPPD